MRRVLDRLPDFLGSRASRRQLEQAKERNVQLERQLEQTRRQLEQARKRTGDLRRRLKQTRQKLRRANKGEQPSKRNAREDLLSRMPKRSVCAEIGVHEGEFSRKILNIVEPECLHLIDPWEHEEEDRYRESWYGGLGSEGQAFLDQRYQAVKERFSSEIHAQRMQLHRSYSGTAVCEFEDSYFDWIYIDGNHLYEFVKEDLELYYPKVKVNGYITGDDYGVQDNWWGNGVQKAVDEFVSRNPELTLEISGTQFIITKQG